jgi:hypothetical protein
LAGGIAPGTSSLSFSFDSSFFYSLSDSISSSSPLLHYLLSSASLLVSFRLYLSIAQYDIMYFVGAENLFLFFSYEFCCFSLANKRRRNYFALFPHCMYEVISRASIFKPIYSPFHCSDFKFTSEILPALSVHMWFPTMKL